MQRAWAFNASNTPPTLPVSLETGYPHDDGPATVPGAWWFHMVTEEMLGAITQAGLVPDASQLDQLSRAIALIAKQAVSTGAGKPVRVVDTVGVVTSFAKTVDDIALVTGDAVLRSVSPANPDNGVYIVNTAGAWTRSPDFPIGGAMLEGMLFSVAEGTANNGTVWQLKAVSGDSAIIGTTPILFANITASLDAKFSQYLLSAAAAVTYAPLTSPNFQGAIKLSNYAAFAVPYINANNVLVSDGNLTFDGTHFATTGRASAAAFVPSSASVPSNGMYLPAANTLAWATNSTRALSINPQGYVAIGAVSGLYQGQITGANQGSAALADGGAVGASFMLQDTNAAAGAGGALLFGTALGGASPFAAFKGLLTDTSTGKVGHLAASVRSSVSDTTLSEVARFTSARNLLVGTVVDSLSSSNGNLIVSGKAMLGQAIGISAGAAGQLQAIGGASTTWYNAMLRNDGTLASFMSSAPQTSAVNAVDAVANTFRPFAWNLSNGQVTIDGTGAGTTFGGPVSGVTALTSDNSTKFATTAYVSAKLASLAGATIGASILAGNGTGGFSNVTIGSGLNFAAGVLTATSSGGTVTSVQATVPPFLSISGGPIVGAGTLAISYSGTPLPTLYGGTGVTTGTGTGNNVLSNSPTLVTPNLGTPSALTLTNATGLPLTTGVSGILGIVNGGSGVNTGTGTGSNVLSISPTFGGTVVIGGRSGETAVTLASNTIDIVANYYIRTMNASGTFVFNNAPAAGTAFAFTLKINLTAGSPSWPASVKWENGVAPASLSTGKSHLFFFLTDDGGVTWLGSFKLNY